MKSYNKITLLLIFLLVASNIVWGILYSSKKSEADQAQSELAMIVQNKNILAFQKMFIQKVLMANGVVDFNTRVELQNAVSLIHDEAISMAWNAFLSAKDEAEGQMRVKELLLLLSTKVYSE